MQVDHGQLLEADGVVGDDVGHGDRRPARPGPGAAPRTAPGSSRPARRGPPPPGRRRPGPRVPGSGSGWCSPDGVQMLLTRVSWQEIRSRPAKQGSGIDASGSRAASSVPTWPPAPPADPGAPGPHVVSRQPLESGWLFDGGHSRVRHRRVRAQFLHPEEIADRAGDHIAAHEVRINDRIRAREVFLVGADGEQLGVRPLPEALTQAREQELDLVEVAPNANPPVCRIMDYGRYVYEQEQRRRQSKRKATNVVIKEMKFRPKIDEHDYTTKMKHVVRFLGEGNKVKLTIMFRGREMAHPELGLKILQRVADDVADFARSRPAPRQDGRNMTMVLHPTRKDGRSRRSKNPNSKPRVELRDAEDEDAPGRRQALQGHRQRARSGGQGEPSAPLRAEAHRRPRS